MLSTEDRRKTLLLTSRVALPSPGEPALRFTVSVLYLVHPSRNADEDKKRIHLLLFEGKANLAIHGITFAVFDSTEQALAKRPSCKSLTVCKAILVSGLNLNAPVTTILKTLAETRAIVYRSLIHAITVRNQNSKGKDLRYLILLGKVDSGNLPPSQHHAFQNIATHSRQLYDLRIETDELPGQLALREAHQGKRNLTLPPPPPPGNSTSLVKHKNNKAAWSEPNSLVRYSAPETTSTNQIVNHKLADQEASIRKLEAKMIGVEEKIEKQAEAIANIATLSQIKLMFDEALAKKHGV